jgi:hypothetical protein
MAIHDVFNQEPHLFRIDTTKLSQLCSFLDRYLYDLWSSRRRPWVWLYGDGHLWRPEAISQVELITAIQASLIANVLERRFCDELPDRPALTDPFEFGRYRLVETEEGLRTTTPVGRMPFGEYKVRTVRSSTALGAQPIFAAHFGY